MAGELTARAARRLGDKLAGHGLRVLFDHGDSAHDDPQCLGRIVSWFGGNYTQAAELAMVDIAVVNERTHEALLLIEAEESNDNPKTLLGDALGTLLGEHLTFQGKQDLLVGPETTLAILARAGKQLHDQRNVYLQGRLDSLRAAPETPNAAIGRILVDTFVDEDALVTRLLALAGWPKPEEK